MGASALELGLQIVALPGDAVAERARLEALREQAAISEDLVLPLKDPATVYHPQQIETRHDKKTGEPVFLRAHGTAENLGRLCKKYGVRLRYNELSREIELSIGGSKRDGELARNTNLSLIEDICRINSYPHTAAAGHIATVAALDRYNPALDWIRAKPWDGIDRIGELFDCLTLADTSDAQTQWALFRKWMIGAAAILSGYANKFEHVLVLVDPKGGIGKTRFFNKLCPPEFQADGVALNVDDKDSVLGVISKWLVELGEIGATFSKSDTEALKAFLSRASDEVRPPYAREANKYPRRTAFFGSVNNVRFLVDDTNNRRFWPIEVTAVNYQHDIDMQQAWAQALSEVEARQTWYLSPDENRLIGEHNEGFRSMDRVEESILTAYDPDALPCRYMSASQVLEEVGVFGARSADTRKAGVVLRKLFQHSNHRGVAKYYMPYPREHAKRMAPARDRFADSPL